MIFDLFSHPYLVLTRLGALIIAITMHEFAHAKMADSLGDPTPRLQDRLKLDPRAHLDPIGSLLILLTGFGWGRPVIYDPYNLENPRRDGMKIAFAGPASNIILALCGSILMKFAIMTHVPYLPDMLYIFIYTNVSLALFNMMPVDPLDGFKIVSGLLSNEQAHRWDSLRQYGPLFFILLFFPVVSSTPPAQIILVPLIALVMKFLG